MKRALTIAALLAMGILVASSFAAAQDVTLPKDFLFGSATISVLGHDNPSSSKFQEYRDLSKGVRAPEFSLVGSQKGIDFSLYGEKVRQLDQRYFGGFTLAGAEVSFDYNQVVHNMGNDAKTIYSEASQGVWTLNPTLRKTLGATADAKLPTSARTFDFYNALLAPTFATTNTLDISSLRKRGEVGLDLSQKLPFGLNFTYVREVKTGYRTQGGGDILGAVSPVVDIPEPLNEVTQDFGIRAAYNFKAGNVHASFNRNIYNNRAETLTVDNPFQATDVAYTSAPIGGPAQMFIVNAPDNEASTGKVGFLLKFAKQTRLSGDIGMAQWTQNAQFYPYTLNTVVKTTAGMNANSTAILPQQGLNGKINTTSTNFVFSSRPVDNLSIRAHYRSYDLSNKTARFLLPGDMSGSPDRSWGTITVTADEPYGYATAVPYDTNTKRFDGVVSYDVKAVTLEASANYAKLTRSYREAESGKDKGYGLATVFHANEWLNVRASLNQTKRTAEGTTIYGFQADEAPRKLTRAGVDIEVTPVNALTFTFGYFRRHVDFTDRPDRVAVASGVVVGGPFPGSPSGLLNTKYDSYSGDIEFTPSERFELTAFYQFEKDAQVNQWSGTSGNATIGYDLNNLLNYAGSDKTNTVGLNMVVKIVPNKWTWSVNSRYQKVNGLMDITAKETLGKGSTSGFYNPGRTTLIAPGQGGAGDIDDWDDTTITTIGTQLDYNLAKSWTMSAGYVYEDYKFGDAFTSGTTLMPQSILIFLKPNAGSYTANVGYAKLSYRF